MKDRARSAREMNLVNLALFAGILLFAAVAFATRGQREGAPLDPAMLSTFRVALYALSIPVVLATLFFRSRRLAAPVEKRQQVTLVGWAVSEFHALAGVVLFYMGGEPWPAVLGIGLMIVARQMLPPDPNVE